MRLLLDLVPSSSWMNNVRACVSARQWDLIKSEVASKAYNMCEICGGIGPKHPVECHEIWEYDDLNLIQKLVGMIALCPACHGVKHMGMSNVLGRGEAAIKHFMKINKISRKEADKIISESFNKWAERSKKQWTLDISLLKDYGIDVKKIKKES